MQHINQRNIDARFGTFGRGPRVSAVGKLQVRLHLTAGKRLDSRHAGGYVWSISIVHTHMYMRSRNAPRSITRGTFIVGRFTLELQNRDLNSCLDRLVRSENTS